jgi:Peptidase family S41
MTKIKHLITLLFFPLSFFGQHPTFIKADGSVKTYSIKKKDVKLFAISLTKDKTYLIHTEQKGIDIELSLTTKEGNKIKFQDSPNGEFGPEIIEYKPDSTAIYILNIMPLQDSTNAAEGKFSIQVKKTLTLNNDTHIATILSPNQMAEDIKIFREIREQANSGLYIYKTKKEVDSMYNWAYGQVAKPLDILAFYRIIAVLTDFEGSCHNWTGLPYDVSYYLQRKKGYFPFSLKYIEGKIFVDNFNKKIPFGSRVITINGKADSVICKALYKYRTTDGYNVSVKNPSNVNFGFGKRYQIEFGVNDNYEIMYTLPNSSEQLSQTVKSVSSDEWEKNYLQRNSAKFDSMLDYEVQQKYSFKTLNDSTSLLNLRIFTVGDDINNPNYRAFSAFLDSIFKEMKTNKQIKNLVIDIRSNPGGNGGALMKAFTYITDSKFRENTLAYINFKNIPLPKYYAWSSSDKENQEKEQADLERELNKEFSIFSNGKYLQSGKYNPY